MNTTRLICLASAIGFLGCYTGDGTLPSESAAGSPGLGGQAGAAGGAGSGGSTASRGLPCEVAQLLSSQCQSCHGSPPTPGTPVSLMTFDDLIAPSKSDPSKSLA